MIKGTSYYSNVLKHKWALNNLKNINALNFA